MAKTTGNTTKLMRRASSTTGVWVAVSGIVDFNGFGAETPEVNASDLDSTAAEFEPGLRDFGGADFTLHVNLAQNTQYKQLISDQQAGLITGWGLQLPSKIGTDRYMHALGWVRTTPIQGGVDAMVDSAFSIRLSGEVTVTNTLP
jgi:hypothetical protein